MGVKDVTHPTSNPSELFNLPGTPPGMRGTTRDEGQGMKHPACPLGPTLRPGPGESPYSGNLFHCYSTPYFKPDAQAPELEQLEREVARCDGELARLGATPGTA